jgi:hypothetical protein
VKHVILAIASALFCLAAAQAEARSATSPDGAFGAAISDQTMSQLRGGAESTQSATSVGDCGNCAVSGTSFVGGGAFNNAAGLITVIQNTGVNVVLQSSTVVNVNIR